MKLSTLVLFLAVIGCASKNTPQPTPKKSTPVAKIDPTSIESKQLANEQESSYVRDIKFARGKTALERSQKLALKKLFQEASSAGDVKEAKVLTWGDQEYPSPKDKKLADSQLKLVDARNKNISDYLKKLNPDLDVDSVSMAERPSQWDKMLSTDEARMKTGLEEAGIPKAGTKVPSDMQPKRSTATIIFINH